MTIKKFKKNVLEWLFENEGRGDLVNVIATSFTLNPMMLFDLLVGTLSCSRKESFCNISEQQLCIMLAENCMEDSDITNRLTVFCDDYILPASQVPLKKYTKLLNGYYIPRCVCRIAMKESGSFFHPKLLIAHFKKDDTSFVRMAILSKNLTYDSSMQEICAVFESSAEEGKETDGEVRGTEVADFIDCFLTDRVSVKEERELNGKSLSRTEARKRIESTLRAIKELSFKIMLPDRSDVSHVSLQFGKPNCSNMKNMLRGDAEEATKFYCCSDSISKMFWEEFLCKKNFSDRYLISNLRSWARYGKKMTPDAFYDYAFSYQTVKAGISADKKIHAKFAEFVCDKKRIVWLGSANFTENGFGRNYEAGVRIEYENATKDFCNPTYDRDRNATILTPAPFVVENDSDESKTVVKKVMPEELKREREKQEFEEVIQKVKWICEINDGGMVLFRGILETNNGMEDIKILRESGVKQYHIVTGTDNILSLNIPEEDTVSISYELFCSDYIIAKSGCIPWYGKALLVGMKSTNETENIEVPIVIEINQKSKDRLEQTVYEHNDVAKALIRGSFDFINIVPPEPNQGINIYDSGDSFDIRLAKYLAKGGRKERLIERIGHISKILEKADFDTDQTDDPDEESDENIVMTEEDKIKLRKRLIELKRFIDML